MVYLEINFPSLICRKSSVNVIDAKTMSANPVAVVELPHRVPYGFHAFFVSEVSVILVASGLCVIWILHTRFISELPCTGSCFRWEIGRISRELWSDAIKILSFFFLCPLRNQSTKARKHQRVNEQITTNRYWFDS